MSALRQHLGLLVGPRPGLRDGASLAPLRVTGEVAWDRAKVDAYRRLTGAVDRSTLPLLAPQVMAAGLHLELFADRRFPFKALGLVHVEDVVTCVRAAPAEATLSLVASVGNARPGPGGTLFDLSTEASDRDGPVGTWTATILARGPRGASSSTEKKPDAPLDGALLASAVAAAPEDIGRRYAAVAGDLNPIHQRAILAKAFGFPRAIAHGMWTLARALAEVGDLVGEHPRRVHARFRKPLFLPGRFVIEARDRGDGTFTVAALPTRGGTPHLVAEVQPHPN